VEPGETACVDGEGGVGFAMRSSLPPLPVGEGWGEGVRASERAALHDFAAALTPDPSPDGRGERAPLVLWHVAPDVAGAEFDAGGAIDAAGAVDPGRLLIERVERGDVDRREAGRGGAGRAASATLRMVDAHTANILPGTMACTLGGEEFIE
jgi:hypothetical protein